MKKVLYVLQLCLIILCSCGDNSEGDGGMNSGKGFAPGDLIGKTLTLKKSNGNTYLSAEHLPTSGVLITSSDLIDYEEYPPSYVYSVAEDNKASYYLTVTKKTYIAYNRYVYAMYVFDIDLAFTSTSGGIYQGIQINGEGKESTITGSFTLLDTGDVPPSSEEGEILLSSPTVSNITTSSVHIEGNIVATDVSIQEQGICYGITPLPTLNDNYKKSATSNISVDLEGLTENTSYNV